MSCDADYSTCETSTYRTARKEHFCCACRETIRKGQRYQRTFQVWEGEPTVTVHCLRCVAVIAAICRRQRELRTDDRGVQWDLDCGHSWQDAFDEEPPPEIARLAFLTAAEAQAEFGRQEES